MFFSKGWMQKIVRILITALFISAFFISPLSGSLQTAAAISNQRSEAITSGLRAAIEDALDPGAFTPTHEAVKLTTSDGALGDFFGYSVALSGDTALVGANRDDDNDENSGSAYIFKRDQGGVDSWGQVKKLTASDGAADDEFGISVALSGNTALVGAMYNNDNGTNSGSVYLFDRDLGGVDNWGEVKKLTASDGAAFDVFGVSVAIYEDTALVGASGDNVAANVDQGSAYLFERNTGGADNWGEVKKLTASDGAAGDRFGISVALSGDTALVGASSDDSYQGSAYIFERNTGGGDNWGQVKKLTASDGATSDHFGYAVALSGDTALVGAWRDDDDGSASGSAYLFERDQGGADNWGQVKKITASDGAAGDSFGHSVALSGDTTLVSAYVDDDDGSGSGSAYLFVRDLGGADNWGEFTKLTASDGAARDEFGYAVALSGDTTLVGARYDDDDGANSGSAYVFDFGASASLGDKVWLDLVPNGIQEIGEIGVSGVTVELYTAGDILVGTTLTAGDGTYTFDELIPGDYYLQFYSPAGYAFTLQNQGGDDSLDSDAHPGTGKTATTTLSQDEDDYTWDAGLVVNLLSNGGFEDPLDTEWTEVVTGNGDGRVLLNKAQEGSYIYLFIANGGLEVIKQTVAKSGTAGDEYTLTLYFGGLSVDLSGKLGARLILKNGGVKVDKKTCIHTPAGPSFSWAKLTCTITATGAFDSIQVLIGIQNVSTGMVGVDAAILNKTGS